jgi:hypothetical protein
MIESRFARAQRMTIVLGILAIMVIITILQLWLFTATMEAHLSGDDWIVTPAAMASMVCFLLNGGLVFYLRRLT